jgi:hypothetical protein
MGYTTTALAAMEVANTSHETITSSSTPDAPSADGADGSLRETVRHANSESKE